MPTPFKSSPAAWFAALMLFVAPVLFAQEPTPPPATQPAQQPASQPAEPIQIPLPPPSTAAPAPPSPFTLTANSRAVLVDIVVTDSKGRPIPGLKAADFRLLEDGNAQPIASLEEHHPSATLTSTAPPKHDLGPNTYTNLKHTLPLGAGDSAAVVFLLDYLNTPVSAQMYVRGELLSYFATMKPGTQVAIFSLDTQLRLLQGFSADPAVLRDAIKTRDKPQAPAMANIPGYVGSQMKMDSFNVAMASLGSYLSTLPGRKNLIWFTGHIPRTTYDSAGGMGGDLHDAETFDYNKATQALVLGQVTIYPVDSRGLATDPAFSAANSKIPNPRAGSSFGTRQFFEHSDLDAVAEGTGGRAFYNSNSIKDAVQEVVDSGASFYTLSYYPTNKSWDGSFRKLKLETANNLRVQLQYRRGYYAISQAPATMQAAAPTDNEADPYGRVQLTHNTVDHAFANTMQLGSVDPNQILFKTRVFVDEAVKKDPKLAKGHVASAEETLEPKFREKPYRQAQALCLVPASQLQFSPDATGKLRHGKLEMTTLVFDPQGTLVGGATATIEMNLKPETFDRAMKQGLLVPLGFKIPEKGSYFLRIGVHDVDNGHAGVVEVPTTSLKIGSLVSPAKPGAPAATPPHP